MPDVQSRRDNRNIPINQVGIKDIRHPITLTDRDQSLQSTIGHLNMFVNLAPDLKGAHMSRFVEVLGTEPLPVGPTQMGACLDSMLTRLQATESFLYVRAPFFLEKSAPASGVKSLLDYEVSLEASFQEGQLHNHLSVQVPVTSLCPCSKAISEYGAHNQRSHVTLTVKYREDKPVWIEELIHIAEQEASCELYGLLKRPDEKVVTERAYDNPKFVEDLVRDIAARLEANPAILAYKVASENFESIHNHSAYAMIEKI